MRRRPWRLSTAAFGLAALVLTLGTAAEPVSAAPPDKATIAPSSLPGGTVGVAYAQQISVSGPSAPYTVRVTKGTLPAGLTLAANGALTGLPSAQGTASVTVSAFSSKPRADASRDYTLSIAAASTQPPPPPPPPPPATVTINPQTLPAATVGASYGQQVTVGGPAPPYTVRVTQGSLPAGLSLSTGGAFSGAPSTAGTYAFTVSAFTSGGTYVAFRDYTLAVGGATPPPPPPPSGTAYFADDFEGGLGLWNREGPASAFSLVSGWSGQAAAITAGPSTTGPTSGSSELASLWLNWPTAHAANGQSTWYAAKVMFPTTYQPTTGQWNWFMEWHVDDYTSAYSGTYSSSLGVFTDYPVTTSPGVNPRLAFRVNGGSVSSPQSSVFTLPSNSLARGRWYDILVHFVWSPSATTGRAELWIDGQQHVSVSFPTLYTLPNGSTSFSYFGLYQYRLKASWNASIYFDRVRIGPTLSSVQ